MPLCRHQPAALRRLSVAVTLIVALLVPTLDGWAVEAPAVVYPQRWPRASWPFAADATLEARVQGLLKKMMVPDKVGQIIQADIGSVTPADVRKYRLGSVLAGGNSKPGGRRTADPAQWQAEADAFYRASMDTAGGHLAIPMLFGIDAVHGDNGTLGATLFPQNSALGATRDLALVRAIGAATAEEVRATGLNWSFAPTIAVPQDDRWGRTYEGYSENPALVAEYAKAAVEGLQGRVGTPAFLDSARRRLLRARPAVAGRYASRCWGDGRQICNAMRGTRFSAISFACHTKKQRPPEGRALCCGQFATNVAR